MASSRLERSTRSNLRQETNPRSATPRTSSSDDDVEGRSELETRQTRRKKREQDIQYERQSRVEDEAIEDDEGEEEEITRCICRKQEYPGPPVPLGESGRTTYQHPLHALDPDSLPEDAGSLFIQCDDCKVWQHGGCVGILDEAMSPDNYYCEECRKDLHKIMTGAKGQRYSRYLPVYEPQHPKVVGTPASKDRPDRSSKESEGSKSSAANARSATSKRRLTMNSRAALEEEEAIRKAIEESKSDGTSFLVSNGGRKVKRSREDSEETRNDLKRRKTGSDSESLSNVNTASAGADSDNETLLSRSKNASQKRSRVSASTPQAQKERDIRDREKEREREREDLANRRKGRAERRRGDEEPEPIEDASRSKVIPTKMKNGKLPQTKPQTPSNGPASGSTGAMSAAAATGTSKSKSARPTTRRGRLGRNQYTRDRDAALDKESPRQSHSRDSDDGAGNGGSDGPNGAGLFSNGNKPSKPKHMNPNRTSMNDMRKRAAGIMEYISRTKLEVEGETGPAGSGSSSSTSSNGSAPFPRALLNRVGSGGSITTASSKLHLEMGDNARNEAEQPSSAVSNDEDGKPDDLEGTVDESEFRKLTSGQMMEILQREIVVWQSSYGKFGDKSPPATAASAAS